MRSGDGGKQVQRSLTTTCFSLVPAAPLPDYSPSCPLGCHHTSQGGKMSLMMHIAERHAHELFRLSHLAAAEAPLPPSLEWGRANKAQFLDAPRKTWAMQDQASQVCAGGDGRQGKPCTSCTPVITAV